MEDIKIGSVESIHEIIAPLVFRIGKTREEMGLQVFIDTVDEDNVFVYYNASDHGKHIQPRLGGMKFNKEDSSLSFYCTKEDGQKLTYVQRGTSDEIESLKSIWIREVMTSLE